MALRSTSKTAWGRLSTRASPSGAASSSAALRSTNPELDLLLQSGGLSSQRSGPLCFVFFSLSKFPPIGPSNGLQRASSVLPASTHIIGLCLSLSINHGLTGSESPASAVNHNTNQGGRDLMAWAGIVGVRDSHE
jgi:hypothetical protein